MPRPAFPDPTAAALIAARSALATHALDGLLLDGAPLAEIAAAFDTPTYVYGADTLAARAAHLARALHGITLHYAVKANGHLALLRRLASLGQGADVVSGGELARALAAGIPPPAIVFSGVGKSASELTDALAAGIGQINVESFEELRLVSALATAQGVTAPIALRINPDVAAGAHDHIATGRAEDKFGIAWDHAARAYALASQLPGLHPLGLAVHIGSAILGATPFAEAYGRLATLIGSLRAGGLTVGSMDCGGGLGIPYADEPAMLPEAWAGAIRQAFAGLDLRLSAEPGRWLVAPIGVLLSRVLLVRRQDRARPIVVLDAAMNDLLRPALYGAWHGIVPVSPAGLLAPHEAADLVGPVCETGDQFARARTMPRLESGDLVAILDSGAYGAVMRSTYNARPNAAEVLIEQGRPALITPRGRVEDLWSVET